MNPVLGILFVLHYLNDGVRTTFVSLLPFVAKDLHLSFTQVGMLSASQGFMAMLLGLPAGFLTTRIGGLKILFSALLLYSLGAIGIGLAPNIWVMMTIFYLGSAGFGLFHAVGNILVARNSSITSTARNMGNYTSVGDMGRISLPTVAIFLATYFGWRNVFFSIAVSGLATYIISQWVLPLKKHLEHNKGTTSAQSYKEWLAEIPVFFRQKNILLVTAAGAIDNIAANPIFVFLPFFVLAKGFPVTMLGIFTGAYFFGSISGKSLLTRGSVRYGTGTMFIIAEICMAITIFIFTLFNNLFVLLGLSVLLGLFARGTTPLISTLLSEVVHEDHYEKVYGLGETFFGLSVIIAPILMGVIADKAGVVTTFYVAAALACFAVVPIFFLARGGTIKVSKTYAVDEPSL